MPSTRALESQSFSPTFTLSILTNYFLSNALKLQTSRAQVAHTPPAKTPEAIMQLSAEHLQNFSQRVFFIEAFYPEQKKAASAAAVRRTLPPWEGIKDEPPPKASIGERLPLCRFVLQRTYCRRESHPLPAQDVWLLRHCARPYISARPYLAAGP